MKKIQNNLCEKCNGDHLKARRTTYSVKIAGKTINIQRVSVKECLECHYLHPTKAGKEKIERCMMTVMSLFEKDDSSSV